MIVENVPEAQRGSAFARLVEALVSLGYRVHDAVLNAADYGVPQRRRRLFVVAGPADAAFRWPAQTRGDPAARTGLEPWRSAWDAIADLLKTQLGHRSVPGVTAAEVRLRGRLIAIRNVGRGRGSPLQLPAPTVTRARSLAVVLDPSPPELKRQQVTPERDPFPEVRRPRATTPLGCRARYARRLTARELARLMAIPDTYRLDRVSEHRAALAIGDAVPPPLARAVVASVVAADRRE